jgi:hypothetical protein
MQSSSSDSSDRDGVSRLLTPIDPAGNWLVLQLLSSKLSVRVLRSEGRILSAVHQEVELHGLDQASSLEGHAVSRIGACTLKDLPWIL